MLEIIKRDGSKVEFEEKKIATAIGKAMGDTEKGVDLAIIMEVTKRIAEEVQNLADKGEEPRTVECIQDRVEELLGESGRFDVAKAYIIYRSERERIRNRDERWEMNELQTDIYEQKYRFEGENFTEFLDRVSGGNEPMRKLIKDQKFLPAGRILAGRGLNERGRKVVYSNCFVLDSPQDNIEHIFDTAKKMARTYSMGGGVGINISKLRPKGARVNNAAKETSGAVSFMDLYSLTTGLIGQAGRRGALMISMEVNHPEIMDFITVKKDLDKVTKANISVMITDEFMEAVINNEDWVMSHTNEETGAMVTKTEPARDIMKLLAEVNWDYAEPGILNWTRTTNWHLNSEDPSFEYLSTNPCGEKPLVKGGSCLLGSLALDLYVKHPFTDKAYFDFDAFEKDTKTATRYLDEVVEEGIPYLPLEEQREAAKDYRNLGVGFMGLADAYIKMGLKYGERDAIELLEEIGKVMINAALQESALMARDLGTYRKYRSEYVLKSPFLLENATDETMELVREYGLRNAELLSIAPNGSISTMNRGISGGIEPHFMFSFTRKTESLYGEDTYYKVYAPVVKDYMELHGIKKEEDLPDFFVNAMTLDYRKRIDTQAAIQKYIDSSISSTVNVPEEFSVEDVEHLYMYAWEKGLKGITIFRDNCARIGILTATKDDEEELDEEDDLDCST